jgi:hypothetical protein
MLGKKWIPNYATIEEAPAENMSPVEVEETIIDGSDFAKKKKKKSQQLSTKGISFRT